jgi:hypothetical protein
MSEDWIEQPLVLPETATTSCEAYLRDHMTHHDLIACLLATAQFADYAATIFDKLEKRPEPPEDVSSSNESKGSTFSDDFACFSPLLAEMNWCRGVDNFLTFVSHLLGQIVRQRPETLKSSKTAPLELILSFDSMDSLVDHLAEKRVHDLAYAGLTKLNDVLLSELGFELFPLEEDLKRAILIVETRNIIVHNRAIVNDIYLKRTGADWITKRK